MASVVSFGALPNLLLNSETRAWFPVRVQCLGDEGSTVLSSDSVTVKGSSDPVEKEKSGVLRNGGIGRLKARADKKWMKDVSKDLEVYWNDGYGYGTDYLDGAKEMIRPDGGPIRWFCPLECGQPLRDSPTLLFLPGIDGVGLGLALHHKALGKVFEIHCLHIPVYDRTPFEGLVKFVEEIVRLEHCSSPNKPIYLVGESLGGCLALAVAARNPKIDLVMILANPATSFDRSQLQHLLPALEASPDGLQIAAPYFLSVVIGNPVKMAMVDIEYRLPPGQKIDQLFRNLTALLPCLSGLADILPMDTIIWKLKMLKSAAFYANSRLHAVKAEVLVLASGKDYMLPSGDEAHRLKRAIQNYNVRYFKDCGHAILMEDGINLLTVIKMATKYHWSSRIDYVSDFLPPSLSEIKIFNDEVAGLFCFAAGSVAFSTLENGRIVKGLSGVPDEGPVLLVGYHNLLGLELLTLSEEFLREKKILIRGPAHPDIFSELLEGPSTELTLVDWLKVFGGVPVTAINFFKVLSIKSHVLLYPGGPREALHYKGEEYKLIWPDQPEFVRMAARFGATIVPFATVGEDDIAHLVLDYNDLIKVPIVGDYIKESFRKSTRIRDEIKGEVDSQDIRIPFILPKVPSGRFYFLFGKPIQTKGMEETLKDRDNANKLYLHVKSEVERLIAFLLKKREEDPYRSVIDRTLYRALYSFSHEVPAFDHSSGT